MSRSANRSTCFVIDPNPGTKHVVLSVLDGMNVASEFFESVPEMLEFYARSVDVILTLEDHVLRGGFGSAVLEELNHLALATPVVRIGWPDQFIEHGKPDALRAKYGISVEATLAKLRPVLYSKSVTPAVKSEAS